MKGLSFFVGGELYAVDVTLVQKVARKLAITPIPSAPEEVLGIANLKGRVVTVMSLTSILGIDKTCEAKFYANTIVFKSVSNHEDQMGIAIEKPGNLISLDDCDIRTPPLASGTETGSYISGVAEIDNNFYRIINIESIFRNYMPGSDAALITSSYGGTENE